MKDDGSLKLIGWFMLRKSLTPAKFVTQQEHQHRSHAVTAKFSKKEKARLGDFKLLRDGLRIRLLQQLFSPVFPHAHATSSQIVWSTTGILKVAS
jgi:hypothetical protein